MLEWVAYPFSSRASLPGVELMSPALQENLSQLSYQHNPEVDQKWMLEGLVSLSSAGIYFNIHGHTATLEKIEDA